MGLRSPGSMGSDQVAFSEDIAWTLQRAFNLKKMHLFMAALGLHCYSRAFSSCGEQRVVSSWSMCAPYCGGFSCAEHGF